METWSFKEILLDLMLENGGVSLSGLARECGIPVTTVSGWLNGDRTPRAEQLIMLADYFGVSVDYLVGRASAERSETHSVGRASPRHHKLISRITQLDEADMKLVNDFMDCLTEWKKRIDR